MKKQNKPDYYNDVMRIVRNYVEYGYYKKEPKKAATAIRRKYKEKTLEDCLETFNRGCEVYQQAISFVDEHKDFYEDLFRKKEPVRTYSAEEITFFNQHSDFPKELLGSVILFIYNWHHQR